VTSKRLPPGPRWPSAVQGVAWFTRPVAFFESCRRRYGTRFTIRLPGQIPFVHLSDAEECKQVLTAPPAVLHPGEGARLLEPIVGRNSVILLDEQPHLSQRRLLLPAFHGERIERLSDLVDSVTEREVAAWPRDRAFRLQPRLQSLTLEIILRAVFGLDPGPRLDRLRELLSDVVDFASRPIGSIPPLQRELGGLGPWARFTRMRGEADRLIFELIDERRASDDEGREDVLAMLLAARHEDGSAMSPQELRDELMTMLVAGHETTASELSWAFSALSRSPEVLAELRSEIAADDGESYLTAVINETLRRKPTLPIAEPRLVKEPYSLGGFEYPTGVSLAVNAYLVHHDPEVYPDPYAFRPERFLDQKPGTYTFLPFGGGRRRCIGASFAVMEMKAVLRAALRESTLEPIAAPETATRRAITISPASGSEVTLRAARAVAPSRGAAIPA
jgi:cytochrome P450